MRPAEIEKIVQASDFPAVPIRRRPKPGAVALEARVVGGNASPGAEVAKFDIRPSGAGRRRQARAPGDMRGADFRIRVDGLLPGQSSEEVAQADPVQTAPGRFRSTTPTGSAKCIAITIAIVRPAVASGASAMSSGSLRCCPRRSRSWHLHRRISHDDRFTANSPSSAPPDQPGAGRSSDCPIGFKLAPLGFSDIVVATCRSCRGKRRPPPREHPGPAFLVGKLRRRVPCRDSFPSVLTDGARLELARLVPYRAVTDRAIRQSFVPGLALRDKLPSRRPERQ